MSSYYVNDTIRIAAAFRSDENALVDPGSVSLTITHDGTSTTYIYGVGADIVRPTVGNYYINYLLLATGELSYEWNSSGATTASRIGGFSILQSRSLPSSFWTPANDHLVFDNLETITLTRLDSTTEVVLRVFRLPAVSDQGSAGVLVAYGNVTQWNIWIQECPIAPEINSLMTDAYGRNYRINQVVQSVALNMWEVETTADAGISL